MLVNVLRIVLLDFQQVVSLLQDLLQSNSHGEVLCRKGCQLDQCSSWNGKSYQLLHSFGKDCFWECLHHAGQSEKKGGRQKREKIEGQQYPGHELLLRIWDQRIEVRHHSCKGDLHGLGSRSEQLQRDFLLEKCTLHSRRRSLKTGILAVL